MGLHSDGFGFVPGSKIERSTYLIVMIEVRDMVVEINFVLRFTPELMDDVSLEIL